MSDLSDPDQPRTEVTTTSVTWIFLKLPMLFFLPLKHVFCARQSLVKAAIAQRNLNIEHPVQDLALFQHVYNAEKV